MTGALGYTAAMNNLVYPSVYESPSIQDFFSQFVVLNQDKVFFSHRYFASKIRWPISYLNDLIKGRRSLTISRCIQLIEFAHLDPIEAERFVFLCLKDNLSEKQKGLVDSKLPKSRGAELYEDATHADLIHQQTTLLVFSTLYWAKKALSAAELIKLTPLFHLEEAKVQASIQFLIEKDVIRVGPGNEIKFLKSHLMLDELYSPEINTLHQDFAKSTVAFYSHFQGPTTLNCGFVELSRSRFPEIQDKLLAFRNWLLDYSMEYATHNPKKRLDETLLFQFDLNLFPVLDKKLAKQISDDALV